MEPVAIGQPLARKDAIAKVTGAARYAADFAEAGMAYAQLVPSRVTKGRIAELDTSAAEAVPGVLLVLTHRNLGRLEPLRFMFDGGEAQSQSFMPLTSDEVRYAGQTIALVVADTQEAADEPVDAAESKGDRGRRRKGRFRGRRGQDRRELCSIARAAPQRDRALRHHRLVARR